MAAFASVAAAGLRATAKGPAGDNTWEYAHAGVTQSTGAPCVRVMRFCTGALALTQQNWVEITDDATV